MMCRDLLADYDGPVLVVAGDSPLMQADSVSALLADYRRSPASCVMGTAHKEDPTGLGRILRDAQGKFLGIVEHRDATPEQLKITEVNMSYYVSGPTINKASTTLPMFRVCCLCRGRKCGRCLS
jgi:bifunctional UDP-N-acetylglucosamine pyrophosphorylase/glucosamine-1-phosphate N-acetyltransferase/UDP-N-acetylglucosamine pyrophosphorylase